MLALHKMPKCIFPENFIRNSGSVAHTPGLLNFYLRDMKQKKNCVRPENSDMKLLQNMLLPKSK